MSAKSNKSGSCVSKHDKYKVASLVCLLLSFVAFAIGITHCVLYGDLYFIPRSFKTLSLTNAEVEDILKSRPILFLGGPHKGGTTLIWQLLSSHRNITGFPELNGVDYLNEAYLQNIHPTMGFLQPVKRQKSLSSQLCTWSLFESNPLNETSSLIGVDNRRKLINEWGYYSNLSESKNRNTNLNEGSLFSLEHRRSKKSRRNYLMKMIPSNMNMITSRFWQSLVTISLNGFSDTLIPYFLFTTRHPIAVALAHQKISDCSNISLQTLIRNYIRQHEILNQDVKKLKYAKIIKYENLIKYSHSIYIYNQSQSIKSKFMKLNKNKNKNKNKTFVEVLKWLQLEYSADTIMRSMDTVGEIYDGNAKYKATYCALLREDGNLATHMELVKEFERPLKRLKLGYSLKEWGHCKINKR
jgi:hypothetical protein